MKNATMRQLRVFESAARHLSVTRAAEELHLTPPAVSIQIRLLEGHANAELFERLGRRLRLTEAGVEALARTREILGLVRDAEEAIAGLGSLEQGMVEASNVEVVEELVNMITTQRAYEMNSKVVSATDQMLQFITNNIG